MIKISESRINSKENEYLEKSIPCHGNVFNGWFPIRNGTKQFGSY